jgi:hypothetical protein
MLWQYGITDNDGTSAFKAIIASSIDCNLKIVELSVRPRILASVPGFKEAKSELKFLSMSQLTLAAEQRL